MPTLDEALEYLGIDYADDAIKRIVSRSISTVDAYFRGAIGSDYPTDDPRVNELALIFISDLYDNRGVIEKVAGNTRRLVDDMLLQLKMELRRTKEGE